MDTLNLYHVESLPGIGAPLLITTIAEEKPDEWTGEMHLLLEDAEGRCSKLLCTGLETHGPVLKQTSKIGF